MNIEETKRRLAVFNSIEGGMVQVLVDDINAILDGYDQLQAENEKLQAENLKLENEKKNLKEALQDLVNEQNGPPLIRDREDWQKAMDEANEVLKDMDN